LRGRYTLERASKLQRVERVVRAAKSMQSLNYPLCVLRFDTFRECGCFPRHEVLSTQWPQPGTCIAMLIASCDRAGTNPVCARVMLM
jgi:hypothetical protein